MPTRSMMTLDETAGSIFWTAHERYPAFTLTARQKELRWGSEGDNYWRAVPSSHPHLKLLTQLVRSAQGSYVAASACIRWCKQTACERSWEKEQALFEHT